jgi:hypothetical protein
MHTVKIKIEACPERNDSGKCSSLKGFSAVIDFDCIIWVKGLKRIGE